MPDCGLQSVGLREETLRLEVKGSDIETPWFDGKGRPLKAVPAPVKRDHSEDWKELQGDLKDLAATISSQKERIDGLFVEERCWPARVWQERYIDHPVFGTIARLLIWNVDGVPVTFVGSEAQDINGTTFSLDGKVSVALWHPAGRSVEEVVAWRRRIESPGIVQPFKQAHLEVFW